MGVVISYDALHVKGTRARVRPRLAPVRVWWLGAVSRSSQASRLAAVSAVAVTSVREVEITQPATQMPCVCDVLYLLCLD